MARRSRGEGSIFKRRSDDRWQANLTLPDGKRKSFYGATKRAAREKLDAARADLLHGLPVRSDERLTVAAYFPEYLAAHRLEVRAQTTDTYESLLRTHVIPRIGALRLTKLTPGTLERLYADLMRPAADGGGGLAAASVAVVHAIVRSGLERAARHGLIARNIADLVAAPRVVRREMRPLTREQARALLAVAQTVDGGRWEPLIALALHTGMRHGELLALRWEDLDLELAQLRVRRTLARVRGVGLVFNEPKTRSGRRRIALARPAVAALRAQRARLREERLAAGAAWTDLDLVFASPAGTPYAPDAVRRVLARLLRRAELPRIRFHDLRHTCATLLLQANVNPKVVSERLGHSSVARTLDVYSHVLPDMQEDAAAVIAAALEG